MRYLVFTTKHHDGFCNFDSKLTDYKITSPESPYGKDIAGQLADACHAANFPLGWYYSPPDWHDANYRNGDRHGQYIKYMHGQIEELLTNYGKVDILWFDGLGREGGRLGRRPVIAGNPAASAGHHHQQPLRAAGRSRHARAACGRLHAGPPLGKPA